MMRKNVAALALAFAALVGLAANASAQTSVTGNITADTVWGGAANPSPIIMETAIFVNSHAKLTILPGTIVRGQPRTAPVVPLVTAGTPGALIVTKKGRIKVEGNAWNPVIMTTAATDNNNDGQADDFDNDGFADAFPGFASTPCTSGSPTSTPGNPGCTAGPGIFYDDTPASAPLAPLNKTGVTNWREGPGSENTSLWGSMVLLGCAPTNNAEKAGIGYGLSLVEGLTIPGFPDEDATYGGVDPHDHSGWIKYLSIRHGGDELGAGNELNGLTIAGIGDGTILKYIEIYSTFDDGLEWFGGTVNGKYFNLTFIGDDTLDVDQGYTGINQFVFVVMPFFNENGGGNFGSRSGDKAGEFDGDDCFPDPAALLGNANLRANATMVSGVGIGAATDPTPWPLSNPNFWNMTIIGSTPDAGSDFTPVSPAGTNDGIQYRNGFAGKTFNSIIINTGGETCLEIDEGIGDGCPGFDTLLNVNAGLALLACSTCDDSAALSQSELDALAFGDALAAKKGGLPNTFNDPMFPGLVNEDVTFDPTGDADGKLVASLKPAPIDPRPGFGVVGVIGGCVPKGCHLDESATFRGAFDGTARKLWTTGWTTLWFAGLLAD